MCVPMDMNLVQRCMPELIRLYDMGRFLTVVKDHYSNFCKVPHDMGRFLTVVKNQYFCKAVKALFWIVSLLSSNRTTRPDIQAL